MKLLPLALSIVPTVLIPPCFADKALDTIRTVGVLRVGTTGDYKPFTFRNPDGTYSGADIVMAQHLAQELRVKVEFVPTNWTTLLPDFMAHKYDIAMGGVSILPERAAQGDFSTPVNIDGKRPIVRCADKDRFTTIAAIDKPAVRVVEHLEPRTRRLQEQTLATRNSASIRTIRRSLMRSSPAWSCRATQRECKL